MSTIDLRSDTVTKPTDEMRKYMAEAPVGDDVYGEDPTVINLENKAAEVSGKEAALFAPSGTQSNLLALLTHCGRGDEYIVGQLAHTYKYEGGGAAVLGSIQPQPIDYEPDATFDLEKIRSVIKPEDVHFARTKLLCLENTHNGIPQPLNYSTRVRELVDEQGLNLHLDGARLFNAAIFHGCEVAALCHDFDSVSMCLSKGLGAPVGSLLCGSKEQIKEARHWRKMLGGGMRQAGVLAAAGIYALEHNIARLEQDHRNAMELARGLGELSEVVVEGNRNQTNMVFIRLQKGTGGELREHLAKKGICIATGDRIRLVTHLDISAQDIAFIIEEVKSFFHGQ